MLALPVRLSQNHEVQSRCDLPMKGSSDRGLDTRVAYDIVTAPSVVYEIACVGVVIAGLSKVIIILLSSPNPSPLSRGS